MDDQNIFSRMDEEERIYAPQELPLDERQRVIADDKSNNPGLDEDEPPGPGIIGTLGSSASGNMAVPNIGHNDTGGGPGDPETEARDPMEPNRPPFPR